MTQGPPPSERGRRSKRRKVLQRGGMLAASVAAHLTAIGALLLLKPDIAPPPPLAIQFALPPPSPPRSPDPPRREPRPAAVASAPAPQPTPPRRHVVRTEIAQAQAAPSDEGLSEAELAGGAGVGAQAGGGGEGCDMARRLQQALRRDRLVQAAVGPDAAGKAFRVWNGDWVAHAGQDGKGLAAVREAILWEVGFAPEACRTAHVHGLVVLSLTEAPDAPRLALGAGDWRWSDLLTAKATLR